MKTKDVFILVMVLLLVITTYFEAQIKPQIKQVAGKEIKTTIWQGMEVQFAANEVAVKILPYTTNAQIEDLLNSVGGKIKNSFDKLGWGLIELPEDKDEIKTIDELTRLSFVITAEPNTVMRVNLEPNDPYFAGTSPATYSYQWALKNTGQTPPTGTNDADIDAPEAWNITTGNSDIIIAVLDTGIPMLNGSLSHPDLDDPNKIILGPDCVGDLEGVRDLYGHGTHVAGIAAAESNNGTGIAGVAWNCKILVVQVLDAYGGGYSYNFHDGVIYAVDYQRNNPGKKVVINYSGGGVEDQEKLDAVIYANTYGVTIVASAGNNDGGSVVYPAAYSSSYSNVIAVSSTDANDTFSSFSSMGSQVCVAAPGGCGMDRIGNVFYFNDQSLLGKNIYSTTPNYPFNIAVDPYYSGDPFSTDVSQWYGYFAGTSMSAPHVSGIAALLLSINSNLTPSQIRNIIQQSADDKGTSGFDNYYGYGRVNAYKALKYAIEHYGGTFNQDVTIPAGNTWNIQPGVTLSFNPGRQLIVSGTLNVQGTSSNMVTFTRNGTSGNWIGIRFNSGSSGSINYANIQYSTWGIFFNNLGNNSCQVSNSYIQNNSSYGIWCENSSLMTFQNNHILNNGSYGIYCNNYSSPYIYYNMIKGHSVAGLYTSYYAAPRASTSGGAGSNVIKDNTGCGIYANYYSVPHFGDGTSYAYNSIYNNTSYEVKAQNGANVWVQYNFWGSGYTFSGSTIHHDYELGSDPNSGRTRIVENPNDPVALQNVSLSVKSSKSVNELASIEGDGEGDLNTYLNEFRKEGNTPEGRYALINIEEYYRKANKTGFEDFVNKEIFSRKGVKDELTVMGLELINHALMDKGNYNEVIKNLEKIKDELVLNEDIEKNTLYALGSVHLNCLNDKSTASKYFDDLKQKFPKDILAFNGDLLLGNSPGLDVSKQNDNEEVVANTNVANDFSTGNYPNPFNPTTTITYTLPETGAV